MADSVDNGPKGLGNLAQALAWVGQRNSLSPVRAGAAHAPINLRYRACQKNITSFQISIALSPAPTGLVGGEFTQAKAWAMFSWPFGPLSTLPAPSTTPTGRLADSPISPLATPLLATRTPSVLETRPSSGGRIRCASSRARGFQAR
jgi:hypothetical protein